MELSFVHNKIIFDLVVKAIQPTINYLRQTYDANLEVNKDTSCFVLHTKHDIFSRQPIDAISRVVSNIFIFSFKLNNPRVLLNEIRLNNERYNFIDVKNNRNIIFLCINRIKLKKRKDLLNIFKLLFNDINNKS